MLVDDTIADRIAIACPAEIDAIIIKDMWADPAHGLLTDNERETLDEAARARREAIQTRRTETRPKTTDSPFRSTTELGSQPTLHPQPHTPAPARAAAGRFT